MVRRKKVQLVMPEHEYGEICSEGWVLPHGVLSIATYLKQKEPLLEIEVFYGAHTPHEEILKKIDADVVGVTTNIGSYRNALEIARKAKERGAEVVLGGPHAAVFHKEILSNRGPRSADPCVDSIVVGEGEATFHEIVKFRKVPIAFSREALDRNALPIPDRDFLDIAKGFEKYVEKFGAVSPYGRATSMFTQWGCTAKKQCGFCGRFERSWRARSPEKFWEEVRYLVEKHGVDFIFVMDDTFPQSIEHVRKIAGMKPEGLRVAFRFFARSDQVNEESAALMRKIGCEELYVGVESGDQRMLDAMGKGTTVGQNLRAAELAAKYGMKLCLSWVLGAPGESEETLENTVKHAKEISERACVVSSLASVWIPLPTSASFKLLCENAGVGHTFRGRDVLDMREMAQEWAGIACKVSYEYMRCEVIPRILELAPVQDIKGEPREPKRASDIRRFRQPLTPEKRFLKGPSEMPRTDAKSGTSSLKR